MIGRWHDYLFEGDPPSALNALWATVIRNHDGIRHGTWNDDGTTLMVFDYEHEAGWDGT